MSHFVENWGSKPVRILYHLREGRILTVIHKRRQPGAEDLTPGNEPDRG